MEMLRHTAVNIGKSPFMEILAAASALIGVGLLAGFLAGLLGIGGGVVIVPLLSLVFEAQGVAHDRVLPLALGTSLATILLTSISSARAHHLRGAVNWEALKRLVPGILVGAGAGSLIAPLIPVFGLRLFFACFLVFVAVQMALPKKATDAPSKPLTLAWWVLGGLSIGIVSSLVGIGGGTLTVPFLMLAGVAAPIAVGTSAAAGFPIALASTIGYVVGGLKVPDLPPWSAGFVHLPAFAAIAAASYLVAPLGARVSHRLPVGVLRRLFALFLAFMAIKMFWGMAR